MRQRLRSHLTFANVVSLVALFVALGGTAAAAVIITDNSQVAPNTISGHRPPSGKHANLITGSINGQDIANRSGVDTCQTTLVKKFGPICAGSDGGARNWTNAMAYCADFGLRLPTLSEAVALARNYDVPGVNDSGQYFWTDEELYQSGFKADIVRETGALNSEPESATHQTVCVTDPST